MTRVGGTTMLETNDLTMTYGERTLWRGLDLTSKPGQLTALTGPSGSGKSTLLNCMGLLEQPTSGEIWFDGQELTRMRPRAVRRFRRDHLGYLFQNYALVENATIAQNIDVALQARGVRGAAARTALSESLERVGLAGREGDRVSRLSGGEQQRVAVARLIVKEPSLVLADEPTGALDHGNTETVVSLLRGLADNGACVVIATHDDWVCEQCDDTVSLD
ncbi:putative ABC transport system ATP-binding protein [Kibdelosporangium banguiense]|uniref:ABC transport system ATP-binding protein n=1 Tax=Kibdelosporangium banguiense TaxID=1365924 RepID=A0ABS4TE18_9PSEU|nr:ABC transporter ATP-binding protein [Kibdelosporangium banguiense]MBP2322091.1 putative ABC transport system ATP-binding protein [Kibdelosporangium banguiense]